MKTLIGFVFLLFTLSSFSADDQVQSFQSQKSSGQTVTNKRFVNFGLQKPTLYRIHKSQVKRGMQGKSILTKSGKKILLNQIQPLNNNMKPSIYSVVNADFIELKRTGTIIYSNEIKYAVITQKSLNLLGKAPHGDD